MKKAGQLIVYEANKVIPTYLARHCTVDREIFASRLGGENQISCSTVVFKARHQSNFAFCTGIFRLDVPEQALGGIGSENKCTEIAPPRSTLY